MFPVEETASAKAPRMDQAKGFGFYSQCEKADLFF